MRTKVHSRPGSVGYGFGIAVSRGVGPRCGLDLALLWLWCRLEAVSSIQPLAWELPYAAGADLKRQKDKKKKNKIKKDNLKHLGKRLK